MTEYIKREDVMERVGRWQLNTREAIAEMIMSVPAADVRPTEYCEECRTALLETIDNYKQLCADVRPVVRGKWLHKKITADFHAIGQCSVCKEIRRIDNFCPNCGADMRCREET